MSGKITCMGFTPSHVGLTLPGEMLSVVAEFSWLPPFIFQPALIPPYPYPPVLGMVPYRKVYALFCSNGQLTIYLAI